MQKSDVFHELDYLENYVNVNCNFSVVFKQINFVEQLNQFIYLVNIASDAIKTYILYVKMNILYILEQ